jgi:hypothetical protein
MRHQERFGRFEPKEEAKREKGFECERRTPSSSSLRHDDDDDEEYTTTKMSSPLMMMMMMIRALYSTGVSSSSNKGGLLLCRSPLHAKIPYFCGFPFHAFAASFCRLFSLKSRPSADAVAFQSTPCRGPSSPRPPPLKAGLLFRRR